MKANETQHSKALFTKKTFSYFESTRAHRKNKDWFLKHKVEFEENVKIPFVKLTERLQTEFASELPRVDFLPRKLSRPVRRNPDEGGAFLRSNAFVYFAEKATSQFEWNPGIYISIGAQGEENVMGVGLYMVSSRQMSLMRNGITTNFDQFHKIMTSRKLKSTWGKLGGETYTRFPRGFDEKAEAAIYLRHKRFFLHQDLTQKRVLQKNFTDSVVKDLEIALPFLIWIRKTVGVYRRENRYE